MIPTFMAQHDEMARLAKAIVTHVTALTLGQGSAADDPLPALRLAMARQVGAHCSAEIDMLREHLGRHPHIAAAQSEVIRRFHDELLAWRKSLMDCNAHWPARKVVQDPRGFLDVFRPLADALLDRIAWENQQFYPKVFGVTPATPAQR